MLRRAAHVLYKALVGDLIKSQRVRGRYPGLGLGKNVEVRDDGELFLKSIAHVDESSKLLIPKGASIWLGSDSYIGRYVELGPGGHIHIGDRASLQDRCILVGDISVGSYSMFSLNVLITSGRHYFDSVPHLLIRDQDALVLSDLQKRQANSQPVCVEEDCWLGVNTVVMPGVTIGRGAVIGANSVVTRDIAPYTVVVGAPAREVRKRLNFLPPIKITWENEADLPYFYAGFEQAQDQRAANSFLGGHLARGKLKIWLADSGQSMILKIKRLGDAPVAIVFSKQTVIVDPSFSELEVPCVQGRFEAEVTGAGVVVAAARTA